MATELTRIKASVEDLITTKQEMDTNRDILLQEIIDILKEKLEEIKEELKEIKELLKE